MKMNMKKEEYKKLDIKPLIDPLYDPFAEIDEKGRLILKAEGFLRYEKIRGASFNMIEDIPYPLDFNTIYKWPKLNQTNYQIDLNPISIKVLVGSVKTPGGSVGQYGFQSDKAMRFKDIKIQYKDKKTTLISYIDDKRSVLDILQRQNRKQSVNTGYNMLGSKNVSRILSIGSSWEWTGKIINTIGGNPNIFESNELLDQMVIATLLQFARRGHRVSHNILLALLVNKVEWSTKKIVESIHYVETREFQDEAISFLGQVICNSHKAKRFMFTLNNSQSLQHWLLGTRKQKGWIPKLQEYFKDRLTKPRNELKYRFTPEEKEKEETSLSKKEDGKNEYELQKAADIALLKDRITQLPRRDRDILLMRYYEGLSLETIGERFSIKKARVSQIVNGEIQKLRRGSMQH
jgi:RNA polymerase sigma factor (sigma-70 family)